MKKILLPFLGLLCLVSCSKDVTLSIKDSPDRNSSEMLSSKEPSITGGGTTIEGGKVSSFSFNAIKHKDGSVTGKMIYQWREAGVNMQVDIDCLTISGNKARMAGYCTKIYGQGIPADYVTEGAWTSFVVEDNGEGKDANPDNISAIVFYLGTNPPLPCSNVNAFATYLPVSGNIQIHH
jgi:hypothetical protein